MGDPPPPPPDRKRPSEADGSDDPPPAAKKSRKEGGSGDAPAPAAPPKPIASLAALDKARRALQLQAALKAKMAGLPPVSERWESFFLPQWPCRTTKLTAHTHMLPLYRPSPLQAHPQPAARPPPKRRPPRRPWRRPGGRLVAG